MLENEKGKIMTKSRVSNMIPKLRANRFIRIAVYPAEVIHRWHLQNKYRKTDDSRYIKSLHGKYHGERCFIIGNGPSLRPEDLNRIKNEMSFASNRIYYMFPRTVWRPSFYISIDNDVIIKELDNIMAGGTYEKFLNYKSAKYGRTVEDHIHYINVIGQFYINKNDVCSKEMSTDLSDHCSQFGTVTANAIELAIYMGFTKIYLLGVDHSYAMTMDENGKMQYDSTVKSNYFEGMKNMQGQNDELKTIVMYAKSAEEAYTVVKAYAEKNNIKICNATRGGKLEIFERVDFDSLF